ncbi:MAG: hypothetical protein NVSMB38_40380 [Ktedonobacteraceae bacterium]
MITTSPTTMTNDTYFGQLVLFPECKDGRQKIRLVELLNTRVEDGQEKQREHQPSADELLARGQLPLW